LTLQFIDIDPDAEGSASALEQNDPHAGVVVKRHEGIVQLAGHPAAERIHLVWAGSALSCPQNGRSHQLSSLGTPCRLLLADKVFYKWFH
jgi:hypothetical protein